MLNKKTDGKEEGVHKFLRADLEALRDLAKEIERKAREAGKMTGESCTQGAETTHDNFPFEQATRDLEMWTRRLAELRPALQDARVVADPDPSSDVVAIGMTVEFIDDYDKGSGVQRVRIGSFMNFDRGSSISYEAPLARLLLGARPGDTREGITGQTSRSIIILKVWVE